MNILEKMNIEVKEKIDITLPINLEKDNMSASEIYKQKQRELTEQYKRENKVMLRERQLKYSREYYNNNRALIQQKNKARYHVNKNRKLNLEYPDK